MVKINSQQHITKKGIVKKNPIKNKLIWDLNSEESHKIFRKVQKQFKINDGGLDPLWEARLDVRVKKQGITPKKLEQEVVNYYKIMWKTYR